MSVHFTTKTSIKYISTNDMVVLDFLYNKIGLNHKDLINKKNSRVISHAVLLKKSY